jgi:hypothetical protein
MLPTTNRRTTCVSCSSCGEHVGSGRQLAAQPRVDSVSKWPRCTQLVICIRQQQPQSQCGRRLACAACTCSSLPSGARQDSCGLPSAKQNDNCTQPSQWPKLHHTVLMLVPCTMYENRGGGEEEGNEQCLYAFECWLLQTNMHRAARADNSNIASAGAVVSTSTANTNLLNIPTGCCRAVDATTPAPSSCRTNLSYTTSQKPPRNM